MKQLDTPTGCFASKSKILQCGVIAHHADSSTSNKPIAQQRIPNGEKMALIRPARFSWVTELVFESVRNMAINLWF
jgi:hypothetical protein